VKEISKSKYARFFFAALVLNLLCSWFSQGFHQADEHFQVLEFCSYKMGNTPAAVLPWEFQAKVRATLLPDIAWVFAQIMIVCKLYSPFMLSFIVRLFTAIAAWFVTCKYCLLLYPKFKTTKGEKLFILLSMFLWFMPYLNVRFTAENISGILFLYGLYGILRDADKNIFSVKNFIIAGFLMGVSFFIRFQMMFAIAGLLAWLVFIKKLKVKYIFILGISALAAIGLNILLDYWFYGEWVFTPYNYYYANIIQHKAASFGVSPWWYYFSEYIMKAVPPLSLLLLGMFFAGMFKNRKDAFVWILVPFIVLHLFTGHKELRFLFPVTFIFIYVTSMGFDYFLTKEYYLKIHKYVYVVSLIICIPLLLYRTFAPATALIGYDRFLNESITTKNTVLFKLSSNFEVTIYNINDGFYRNPDINLVTIDSLSQMGKYLQANHPDKALYITDRPPTGENFDHIITGYKTSVVYSSYPTWVSNFDINNWVEKNHIPKIYQFTKIE
jgi:phosphatidylinositol glycan class B